MKGANGNGESATFWFPARMTPALNFKLASLIDESLTELSSSFQTVPESLAIESVVHIVPHDMVSAVGPCCLRVAETDNEDSNWQFDTQPMLARYSSQSASPILTVVVFGTPQ